MGETSFLTFFKSHQMIASLLYFLLRLLALNNFYFWVIWLSYTDVNLSSFVYSRHTASFLHIVIIFLLLDGGMTYLTNTGLICFFSFFSQLGIKKAFWRAFKSTVISNFHNIKRQNTKWIWHFEKCCKPPHRRANMLPLHECLFHKYSININVTVVKSLILTYWESAFFLCSWFLVGRLIKY